MYLTGDGCGVVRRVGSQVLRGLGGGLRQALRASAVTHAEKEEGQRKRIISISFI